MITERYTYPWPSMMQPGKEADTLVVSTNLSRPVRFHGRLLGHKSVFRQAMCALLAVINPQAAGQTFADMSLPLDPVVSIHRDRVVFEVYAADQSAYAALILHRSNFQEEGRTQPGTANVDLSARMAPAIAEMRSSREMWLRIGSDESDTIPAGRGTFDRAVTVREGWVRSLLQTHAAMALAGTRLSVRPADIATVLHKLRENKTAVEPQAIRWVFEPGHETRVCLEPWEIAVTMNSAIHRYVQTKTIRLWGRERLALLEPLLPFAKRVDLFLKGSGLPSFYSLALPGMTFMLGVTGWSAQSQGTGADDVTWARTSAGTNLDLLGVGVGAEPEMIKRAYDKLVVEGRASKDSMAHVLEVDRAKAGLLLARLCRQGRAMYDVETRGYRPRDLFAEPFNEARYFEEQERVAKALAFVREEQVKVVTVSCCENRRTVPLRLPGFGPGRHDVVLREWSIRGAVAGADPVEAIVRDDGGLSFGRCVCGFYREHQLTKGPCEHLLALMKVGTPDRTHEQALAESRGINYSSPGRSDVSDAKIDTDPAAGTGSATGPGTGPAPGGGA